MAAYDGAPAAAAAAAPAARDVRASLPLEIALYFHGVYGPVYAIVVLALIVYKGRSPCHRAGLDRS